MTTIQINDGYEEIYNFFKNKLELEIPKEVLEDARLKDKASVTRAGNKLGVKKYNKSTHNIDPDNYAAGMCD